ncbi:hypothetical protein D7030_11190 [Flavobacteriaceae bacterium AU392]|nr:hypothetical protein D1817_13480 [Flavobacteriaceae bacterium]RKM82725.1 hypothetical protein D7030_11190 [Flavobacteriaceae bacterium AU392]
MYYYFIVALQVFCIYHLYKNRNEYYWVFLILFLPLLGSLIYLFLKVFNRQDVESIQKEVTTIINPGKRVSDLEKQLQFSDTFQNRVNFADALFGVKDYQKAIHHYKETLSSSFQDDYYVITQLITSFFEIEDYKNVVFYVNKIKDKREFQKSKIQFLYGLTLEKLKQLDKAEIELRKIDQRYSFYQERLILAKFLISRNKQADAKEILEEIYTESEHMTKLNRQTYRATIIEVEQLLNTL